MNSPFLFPEFFLFLPEGKRVIDPRRGERKRNPREKEKEHNKEEVSPLKVGKVKWRFGRYIIFMVARS
jgi:hypothetical protein